MSLRDGWPAVSNAADQFDIRAALRVDTALDMDGNIKTGVAVTGKSLSGLVTARRDMQVDVAAFAATLDRQGPVKLYNDGVVQVKLDAAPTANSRIDAIYVKQQETASPISDSADGPIFGKVTGTPSTSPVAPTVPAGAMRLADVTIPSTATSTSSSGVTIIQRYPYTASAGGLLQCRVLDDLQAWRAPDGYHARLLDGSEYIITDNAWIPVRVPWQDLTMLSGFTANGGYGYPPLRIRRDGNRVTLYGVFGRTGGWEAGYKVATIPAGLRPSYRVNLRSFALNTGDVNVGQTADQPDLSTVYMNYTKYGDGRQLTAISGSWVLDQ